MAETPRQGWTPTRKIGAGGLMSAATVVLLWAMGQFAPQVDMSPEVAGAIVGLVYGCVGWLVADRD